MTVPAMRLTSLRQARQRRRPGAPRNGTARQRRRTLGRRTLPSSGRFRDRRHRPRRPGKYAGTPAETAGTQIFTGQDIHAQQLDLVGMGVNRIGKNRSTALPSWPARDQSPARCKKQCADKYLRPKGRRITNRNYPPAFLGRGFWRCQATISRMVWKGFAPLSLAVSTVGAHVGFGLCGPHGAIAVGDFSLDHAGPQLSL